MIQVYPADGTFIFSAAGILEVGTELRFDPGGTAGTKTVDHGGRTAGAVEV